MDILHNERFGANGWRKQANEYCEQCWSDLLQRNTNAHWRVLVSDRRATFKELQLQANRWTYLGSGMTHPAFLESVSRVLPAAAVQIEEMAPAFYVHAHSEA